MSRCPVCSSDEVYDLLDTLHCKRCKNIWKLGDGPDWYAASGSPLPDTSLRIRKKTEPLERRLEKKLQVILTRSGGKFCPAVMTWQAGEISQELFRSYLKRCVNNRTLSESKDPYGRTWYFR